VALTSVLFDLDGTLTDSALGITNCLRYALAKLGRADVEADEIRWTLGPPIQKSFEVLLETHDPALIQEGVDFYRERFSTVGWLENSVYDGVEAALDSVRAEGLRLFVATSKPQVFAHRILSHFGLADRFEHVYGSELNGSLGKKGDLIAYVLAQEGLKANDCLMVGDREHDVIGAKANGMECLGVTYGYGGAPELLSAGAVALVEHPREWASAIRTLTGTL
jgi:phosphoglycolate phosphatase